MTVKYPKNKEEEQIQQPSTKRCAITLPLNIQENRQPGYKEDAGLWQEVWREAADVVKTQNFHD